MNRDNRTRNIYINTIVTLACQIAQITLGFIVRKYFIDFLGVNYLGYNSVFQNVLQALNLADLGVGVAITSFLYRPLACDDKETVSALMNMYREIYRVIGLSVLCLGIILSFFLGMLIPDALCSIRELRIFFYINLLGTVSTYYLAYKRTLIIADQKSYRISLIDSFFYICASILQIIGLVLYPNYVLYLVLNVGKNIVSNIIVSMECNRIYGKLNKNYNSKIITEIRPQVFSYMKDVFASRIGAYIYYSTDNIIISIFKGSILAGYLSNYTLITTQVLNIVNQIFSSIQATYGNYINVTEDISNQKKMTDYYICMGYCVGNFCMICTFYLIQSFVELFFGAKYVLDYSTALLLAVNLMLTIMIQIPSQVFMVYKLYKYDKPIIIISASINVIVSAILVRRMGVNGVLIGTLITSIFYLISRVYVVNKKIYNSRFVLYIVRFVGYFVCSFWAMALVHLICKSIAQVSILAFFFRTILVIIASAAMTGLILCLTSTYEFIRLKFLHGRMYKILTRRNSILISTLVLVFLLIIGNLIGERVFSLSYKAAVDNKSVTRKKTYMDEGFGSNNKIITLSFDDTVDIFIDLFDKNNDYKSVFENSTLAWFKFLHEKYNVTISCFVFYQDEKFNLLQCDGRFLPEFENNSSWLRFGFHALDKNTIYGTNDDSLEIVTDYENTINALKNIVGNSCIDNVIRLQSFQGTKNEIKGLIKLDDEPIVGLLSSDDGRNNYYLSNVNNLVVL